MIMVAWKDAPDRLMPREWLHKQPALMKFQKKGQVLSFGDRARMATRVLFLLLQAIHLNLDIFIKIIRSLSSIMPRICRVWAI